MESFHPGTFNVRPRCLDRTFDPGHLFLVAGQGARMEAFHPDAFLLLSNQGVRMDPFYPDVLSLISDHGTRMEALTYFLT